jgi:hypothetical protein
MNYQAARPVITTQTRKPIPVAFSGEQSVGATGFVNSST